MTLLACLSVANVSLASPVGTNRVDLAELIHFYGFPRNITGVNDAAMSSTYSLLRMTRDSRRLDYNGTCLWLNDPTTCSNGIWSLSRTDQQLVLDPILRTVRILEDAPLAKVVVLDPGHGGVDGGAVARTGAKEKSFNLDMARRVAKKLRHSGLVVRLTRTSDQDLSLGDRSARAKAQGADLFVSIHANFAASAKAKGIETFVMTPAGFASTASPTPSATHYPGNDHDAASYALAYLVHRAVLQQTPTTDRGVKHARFAVLREAPCPAVLVECGFLSNTKEASRLATPSWRERIANGIVHGILTYSVRSREAHAD